MVALPWGIFAGNSSNRLWIYLLGYFILDIGEHMYILQPGLSPLYILMEGIAVEDISEKNILFRCIASYRMVYHT